MYFKCIWWYLYLGVISCVLLYMCVHTGLHGAGSVTAGGTGGWCDDILWCRVVAGSAGWPSVFSEKLVWWHPTFTSMLYVALYVYVCVYVCLLTIKKPQNTRVSHKMKHYSRRQNKANANKIVNVIPYIRIYINLYVKPEAKMKKNPSPMSN